MELQTPIEVTIIRAIQIVIAVNTAILAVSYIMARGKKITLHKKLSAFVIASTFAGVLGLVVTLFLGMRYQDFIPPLLLNIHRSFSTPLFFTLLLAGYFGARGQRIWHLRFVRASIPLWFGTLITGLCFF